MRRRRVLSLLLSAFIICFTICGPTYASGILVLEDMGIDPWADLDQLPGLPDTLPIFPQPETEEAPEEAGDDDIMVMSLPINPVQTGSISGTIYGIVNSLSYTITAPNFDWGNRTIRQTMNSFGINIYANTSITFTRTYSAAQFVEQAGNRFVLKGKMSFRFRGHFGASNLSDSYYTSYVWPSAIDFMVNGVLMGKKVSLGTDNMFDLTDYSIPIPSDGITSFGVRLYFDKAATVTASLPSVVTSGTVYVALDWSYSDSAVSYEVMLPADSGSETNGLLGGIIEFLQGILTNIKNIATGIIELPGKIVTALLDGLKSLFVPSDADMQDIASKYNGLFEDKLGFVYQLFSFLVDTFGKIKDTLAASQDYSFNFPGISFPMDGGMITILPPQSVSLDNAAMDVIRPVLGTIVTIVAVLAIVGTGFDMVVAIMSGETYWGFIAEKREEFDI